jgi:hypothetical protein
VHARRVHHSRRHAGLPRHHDPRKGRRAEPQYRDAHRRRPSDGRLTGRHDFNTQTGQVLQTYSTLKGTDSDGSHNGIRYTPDGLHLLFSQDGNYGPASYVAVANVDPVTV